MKAEDVWHRCNDIAALEDPERYHSLEDDLAREVLAAVATGALDEPSKACGYVAQLMASKRSRWYA
jgi:hypothetical protein